MCNYVLVIIQNAVGGGGGGGVGSVFSLKHAARVVFYV